MFPISSIIYLTTECKLNCEHCFIKNKYGDLNVQLNLSVLKKVIDDFSKCKMYLVSFTGGDIQYYSDLFEIINFTYSKGMLPLLGLSGTDLSDDFINKLANCKFGCVQVSLDGSNDKYNSITRPAGSFYEVVSNIKKMQELTIKVNVAICLHKDNLVDLYDLLTLLYRINIYKIKIQFYFEQHTNIKVLSEHDKKLAKDICNEFKKENCINSDWIAIDIDDNIAKYHSSSIIIMSDGNVCWNEDGPYIGNVYYENIREIMCKNLS